jgi:hypothetical protein
MMPAAREAPSMSQPKSKEMIPPGTTFPVIDKQMNPAAGE